MRRNSLEKCAVRSHDGHYRAHIATAYYISRLLYHKILLPPLIFLYFRYGYVWEVSRLIELFNTLG